MTDILSTTLDRKGILNSLLICYNPFDGEKISIAIFRDTLVVRGLSEFFETDELFDNYKKDKLQTRLIWKPDKQPKLDIPNITTISELTRSLQKMKQSKRRVLDPKSSAIKSIESISLRSKLQNEYANVFILFWKIFVIGIIPLFWIVFFYQIVINLLSSSITDITEIFTLGLLLIVSITFASPSLYVIHRWNQDKKDLIDQIELLRILTRTTSQQDMENKVKEYIQERDDGLYWKVYHYNWDLSLFHPDFTIVDIIGSIFSLFSLVYLITWFFKSLQFYSTVTGLGKFSGSVVILDLILISLFAIWTISGSFYGLRTGWNLKGDDSKIRRLILVNVSALLLGLIAITILEIVTDQFSGTFGFVILLAETPLITAFLVNKINLFSQYNRLKYFLIKHINLLSADLVASMSRSDELDQNSLNILQYVINSESRNKLIRDPILPITRIRGMLLVFTALISVLTSIITAFVTSVDQFTEILSSFP